MELLSRAEKQMESSACGRDIWNLVTETARREPAAMLPGADEDPPRSRHAGRRSGQGNPPLGLRVPWSPTNTQRGLGALRMGVEILSAPFMLACVSHLAVPVLSFLFCKMGIIHTRFTEVLWGLKDQEQNRPSAHVTLLPVPEPKGTNTGLVSTDGSLPLRKGNQQGQGSLSLQRGTGPYIDRKRQSWEWPQSGDMGTHGICGEEKEGPGLR